MLKSKVNFFVEYFLLLIPSVALALFSYFACLEYFWSKFSWSPFGHEECGIEGLVWPFVILPFLLISFLLKIILVLKYKYPKIFWITPMIIGGLISMYTLDKGFGQGIMAFSFFITEIVISIYSVIKKNDIKKKSLH